jgi:hypothetical protein
MFAIDIETKEDKRYSMSNLIQLKILFDAGIDVSNFPRYNVQTAYNEDEGFDIFVEGLKALFHEVEVLETEEEVLKSIDEETLPKLGMPEYTIIVKDPLIKKALDGVWGDSLFRTEIQMLPNDMMDTESDVLKNNEGFVVFLNYIGMMHETLKKIVEIKDEAIRLQNWDMEESINESDHGVQRSAA